jgi:hypothetical protein
MDHAPVSQPRRGIISPKEWPTVLVALPIQLGFLVYLLTGGLSLHLDPTPWQQFGFLVFLFHFFPGTFLLSLFHIVFPGDAFVSLLVIFIGSVAVSLLYARILCLLFAPFFRRDGSVAQRVLRVLPGLTAMGLAAYVGVNWVGSIRPSEERSAIRDIRGLENLMGHYSVTRRPLPEGDAADKLRVLLGVNQYRHSRILRIDPARLGADGIYRDPWGSPYAFGWNERPWAYSFGPNRIDEGGKGDDISNWR